jgi:hypothetical protein
MMMALLKVHLRKLIFPFEREGRVDFVRLLEIRESRRLSRSLLNFCSPCIFFIES